MRIRNGLLGIAVLSLALTGCGGSGGGGTPAPAGTDFVTFFTGVFQTSAAGTDPVPLAGIAFTNQFPADESTFDPLLP